MFRNKDKGEGPNKRLLPSFVKYIEWLRLSCFSVLFYISGIYVPYVGIAIALASPAPISLIGLRQGALKAFLSAAFASAALYLLFGEAGAVSFALGTGLLGIIFGVAARKLKSAGEAIFALIIVSLASKLLFMWFIISTSGHNPFALDESSVNEIIKSLDFEVAPGDIAQQMNLMIPFFLIAASAVDTLVNYLLVSRIENRRGGGAAPSSGAGTEELVKIPPLPPFGEWSFPRSLLTAFLSAFLIGLFDASGSSRVLLGAEVNLKILTGIMFFVQGLSFVWWWMLHRNFSHGVRLAALIILLFVPIFSMGLIIIGIIDIIINLRGKIRRNDK